MTAVDLDAIRHRSRQYQETGGPTALVHDLANDVVDLLAEVDRLNDTIRRVVGVRNIAINSRLDLADLVRDLLRLLAAPRDWTDEQIVRERAEALLAKVPPRSTGYTAADLMAEDGAA